LKISFSLIFFLFKKNKEIIKLAATVSLWLTEEASFFKIKLQFILSAVLDKIFKINSLELAFLILAGYLLKLRCHFYSIFVFEGDSLGKEWRNALNKSDNLLLELQYLFS